MQFLGAHLFASDLPAEEILHLAWEAATPQERKEILDAALEFAPHLDGLPMQEAWRSLARIIVIIYLVLTFGWAGSPGHFQAFALTVELLIPSVRISTPKHGRRTLP